MFGPRGVTRTPRRGLFHCPRCEVGRAYAYREKRRFFTIFSIPLFALAEPEEYVQCGFCRSAFKPSVLDSQPVVAQEMLERLERQPAGQLGEQTE